MDKNTDHRQVNIGDKVLVVLNGEAKELEIVDVPRGDPGNGRISWLTPLAQALLGKTFPENVTVKLPNGRTIECKLIKIV